MSTPSPQPTPCLDGQLPESIAFRRKLQDAIDALVPSGDYSVIVGRQQGITLITRHQREDLVSAARRIATMQIVVDYMISGYARLFADCDDPETIANCAALVESFVGSAKEDIIKSGDYHDPFFSWTPPTPTT